MPSNLNSSSSSSRIPIESTQPAHLLVVNSQLPVPFHFTPSIHSNLKACPRNKRSAKIPAVEIPFENVCIISNEIQLIFRVEPRLVSHVYYILDSMNRVMYKIKFARPWQSFAPLAVVGELNSFHSYFMCTRRNSVVDERSESVKLKSARGCYIDFGGKKIIHARLEFTNVTFGNVRFEFLDVIFVYRVLCAWHFDGNRQCGRATLELVKRAWWIVQTNGCVLCWSRFNTRAAFGLFTFRIHWEL